MNLFWAWVVYLTTDLGPWVLIGYLITHPSIVLKFCNKQLRKVRTMHPYEIALFSFWAVMIITGFIRGRHGL